MRRQLTFFAAALLSSFAIPAIASAETARVTSDLNMRAGPSTEFPVVSVLPDGAQVDIYGCVGGFDWCDVSWQGERGWASGQYLTQSYQGNYVRVYEYGPRIGVPVIGFSIGTYLDNYYRGRSWYGRRDRWRSVWRDRDNRRDSRADRREERRENRVERREDRIEQRRDRRAERREGRQERRVQSIRERRAERNERTRERRQERRVERRQERRAENRQERRVERRQERRAERGGRDRGGIDRGNRGGREARGGGDRRGGGERRGGGRDG